MTSGEPTPVNPYLADDEPPLRGRIPIMATVAEAFRLIRNNPRTTMLPQAAIGIPTAIGIGAITVFLFVAAFPDEDVIEVIRFQPDADRAALFVWAIIIVAEAMLLQVARGATIVAVAGTARGRPPSLVGALDPAFTRLGGLIGLVFVLGAIAVAGFITVVGLIVLPYLLLRLALAFDAYMLEEVGVNQALLRSWRLMSGNMIRLLGVLGISLVLVLPVILALSSISAVGDGRTTQLLFLAILGVIRGAALVPVVVFLTACTTLYYLKTKAVDDAFCPP